MVTSRCPWRRRGGREAMNRRVLKLFDLPAVGGETLHVAKDREILVTDDGAELSRQIVAAGFGRLSGAADSDRRSRSTD
ncbi:MAG: hypothetical protein IPK83_01945 [Planctomycetes bacterium]|nr:hypothetical protein [Planctomycetota bacterium]